MTDRSTGTLTPPEQTGEEQVSRRAAKKERTRRSLIEAATEVIAERGFHAASLMEVASRAGLTTGAIYSNFRSKEDLFLAVIQDVAIPLDLGPDSAAPWERLRHAAIMAARDVDGPHSRRLLTLQLEFALLTIQDSALLHDFVDDIRVDQQELAGLLATASPAPRPEFKPSPEQLATAIMATLQGLQQHRFLDRAFVPEELAGWAVQALLHVAMERDHGDERRT
jgi:AcrR family transcriptional regulator